MKTFLRVVLYAAAAGVLVCLFLGFVILRFSSAAAPVKSDCIIILGCKVKGSELSPFLIARTDEGLRLYNEGYGEYIIVSGGRGPGEDITEAQAMKDYLVGKGVEPSRIIIEDKSTSTYTNIKYSSEVMKQRGMKSAVIVSNKYHLRRASLMAKSEGIEGSCSGVFVSDYKTHEITGFLREILALGKYYILG